MSKIAKSLYDDGAKKVGDTNASLNAAQGAATP